MKDEIMINGQEQYVQQRINEVLQDILDEISDKFMDEAFYKAKLSEYNRRMVLIDEDDDLYYTGRMDGGDMIFLIVQSKIKQ